MLGLQQHCMTCAPPSSCTPSAHRLVRLLCSSCYAITCANLQAVTEWTIEPEAAHPLQRATEVPGAVGQVQFGRAGPDPSPGVEELLAKASKQHKYQRRRGFQLPDHDVSL